MMLKRWEDLPEQLRNEAVRPYYGILKKKQLSLLLKRVFDLAVSAVMLVLLSPVLLILAVCIKVDSPGPVFYRQERITQYARTFRIFKFRTMVVNADKIGALVTTKSDARITRMGEKIRRFRLDELPQLINVFLGDMTFVGTRPEVKKYVDAYTPEMLATLLLPAGVTSEASIHYKDEDTLLEGAEDVDAVYVQKVLPGKMIYNLRAIREFSFWKDIATMFRTVFAVLGKEYGADMPE